MNTAAKIMLKVKLDEAYLKHQNGLITKNEMLRLVCEAKIKYCK